MAVFQNFCSRAEEFICLSLLSLLNFPWGRSINKRGVYYLLIILCREVGLMVGLMTQSMVYSSHSQLPKGSFC